MGFFGHNSLDLDAPSSGRSTQSTFNGHSMFKYHKQLFLRKHVDKKSSQGQWSTPKRKRGKKQRMRTRSGLSTSDWSVSHSVIIILHTKIRKVCSFFFSAKYRSFMNPRNEQSPDIEMRFGDSISHSFSVTQTHEDQMPERLGSPGKN